MTKNQLRLLKMMQDAGPEEPGKLPPADRYCTWRCVTGFGAFARVAHYSAAFCIAAMMRL